MRDGLCRRGKSMPGVLVVEIALLLFSCVAKTLEAAHFLCEDWMMRRERY